MKHLTLLLFGCIAYAMTFAQSPQLFQYQSVVRDGNGDVVVNQSVSFQISLISGSATGTVMYAETHIATTNAFGLVTLAIGEGTVVSGSFIGIDWASASHFLKVEADITGGTAYIDMGTTQLLSVPYALYAETTGQQGDTLWKAQGNNIHNTNQGYVGVGLTNPVGKMVVQGDSTMSDTIPLFEVKNAQGEPVFVVYPDSVHIYINDDGAKSNKGGFAVSGRNNAKTFTNDYLVVSPDSTRIYINQEVSNGGFAVKGNELLTKKDLLNVSVDTTETINPPQDRVLWYPAKSAFLTGKVLIESPDSVGINSFASGYTSKAPGNWSQALGYQPVARGNYSTSIGKYSEANGQNSFAFGDSSLSKGTGSFSLGYKTVATGTGSLAFGSAEVDEFGAPTGNYTEAGGDYSFALGLGAKTTPAGLGSISLGMGTSSENYGSAAVGVLSKSTGRLSSAVGYNCLASGDFSLAIGANDTASGTNSFTMGVLSKSSGASSMAIGNNVLASGMMSAAIGFNSTASGDNSMAIGRFVSTNGNSGSIIMGDASTLITTNSTNLNQFMVRASGGYVFYTDPLLLEINTLFLSQLTGNLGVGWSAPQAKVDINGSIRVNSGTTINKIVAGTATAGTNLIGGVLVVNVVFPTPFTGTPKVNVTPRGGNFSDVFVVTTRNINNLGFQVNIYRVDNGGGSWNQNLELDWFAWN